MAVNVPIRVIRVWDTEVEAEYGDTPETLSAKVTEEFLDTTAPSAESRVLLPVEESRYATRDEMIAAEEGA
jgi:hypothetical protein